MLDRSARGKTKKPAVRTYNGKTKKRTGFGSHPVKVKPKSINYSRGMSGVLTLGAANSRSSGWATGYPTFDVFVAKAWEKVRVLISPTMIRTSKTFCLA